MANTEYVKAKDDAAIAIQENGGVITVWRPGANNPVEGSVGDPVKVYDGHAVQTNFSRYATDGERIKAGDKKFLVVVPGELKEEDQIIMAGATWFVKDIKEIRPDGDTLILSIVQVRR